MGLVYYIGYILRVALVLVIVAYPNKFFDLEERVPEVKKLTRWWYDTGLPDVIFLIARLVIILLIGWVITGFMIG